MRLLIRNYNMIKKALKLPKIPKRLTPITAELLQSLGISRPTMHYWLIHYHVNGKKLGKKIGGRWYIDLDLLSQFVNAH